jgi:hypothetical protein|nr:MAG TPA: protein of unknown function DUF859 [Caudoviricetes sp.]
MAMTGGTAYLVKSEYTNSGSNNWTVDLYVYVKVVSQNAAANTSTVALGMYVYSKYNIDWTDWSNGGQSYVGTATSGSNCFTFTEGQTGSGTKWLIENKQVTVTHNANGTLTLPIYWHWGVYSTWGQYLAPSGSKNVTLTAIDRTAPTVSFTTSNITANGVTISASSSATADIWQYSSDNGSTWTQFSTTAGTSASKAITGLSPNTTYNIKVKTRKQSNQVYGTSAAVSVKTLGGAIVNSANQVTADAATVSIKLNVTVYDASYNYTLTLKNGSTSILSVGGLTWSKGTADRTVTLSAAERTTLLTAMANMKSFTGTFAVTSYSGSTQIGSVSSKAATVTTTAANSGPTLSGFTYADSYATTTAITGNDQVFIQNHSKLTVTPGTATAKNQATIANYTATCNGVSISNTTGAALTVGAIAKSGTVAVVLTVTDSRGYTASVTKNITVIAYAAPKVTSLTLRRTNDIEAEMQLIFNGSISAITVDSVQKNSLKYVRYRYKATSASSYSSYVSILSAVTQSGTIFSYSNLELRSLASDQSWDVHIQIQDQLASLSSLDLYYVIPQGTPLVALRKQKVGINTPTPEAALDVVGDAKVSGTLTAATLSGSLAPAKLSAAVPISKGGTGATTAAAARTNLAVLPLAGGTMTGQIQKAGAGKSFIQGRTGAIIRMTSNSSVSSFFSAVSIKTPNGAWDIGAYGESLYMVYGTDENFDANTNTTVQRYINSSGNFNGKAANVTGTVALANGGTGAATAAAARTNLGIACTSLYSGTLTGTNSCTFNYGNYNFYIIVGLPTSSSARIGLVVPKAMLTTSDVKYQIADDANYCSFYLKYSGSTVTMTRYGGNGQIIAVYGVN